MTEDNFHRLLNKWRNNQMSPEEAMELAAAVNTGRYDQLLQDAMEIDADLSTFDFAVSEEQIAAKWKEAEQKIKHTITGVRVHRIHFLKTAWFRVAVAVLIILTGVLVYTSYFHASDTGKEMVKRPGGNKAVLTLADGSQIILDSAATGKLAQQNGATIQKSGNGEIIYAFDKTTVTGSVVYNTMSTPRGGQYQLILPDGSKVWLNAESSVTFPTAFTGNTREIKMTGEAYFEIKPDKTKPFIVKTASDEIQVLGTSFNINAYNDAPVKTSLLEGSIKVNTVIIKPGQAYANGHLVSTSIEQDLAWKNGYFNFNGADVPTIMRQLRRWYDVDIKYVGEIKQRRFLGKVSRDLTLSQVLDILHDLNIDFEIKGRTLFVK